MSLAKIKDCCEKKEDVNTPKCCKKKNEHKEKKKCCSDSRFSKQLKTDLTFSAQKTFVDHVVIIPTLFKVDFTLSNSTEKIISYTDPSPPLSGRSILVKKQSFLI